ncbi:MAG: hypothetical protein AAB687_01965 [Patescibacteria group bacterium]
MVYVETSTKNEDTWYRMLAHYDAKQYKKYSTPNYLKRILRDGGTDGILYVRPG